MTSGAKVVLAMFGGALAIALFVVAAVLLTDEPGLLCVEGELQDNQAGPDGQFLPRIETFATIDEAEAFVCKHVPHPRDTGGLVLLDVSIVRSTNLGQLVEGDGRAAVTFHYGPATAERPALSVQVSFPAQGPPGFVPNDAESITVAGNEAALVQPEQGVFVYWAADGFDFATSSTLDGSVTLDEVLRILESVR
ncbi:MAG TPA: hypothetical protein VFS30_16340 [Dehalococcoidia bacterium]|nr:hypothetical protein [Dehalococcoidia bacterium]